MNAMLTTVSALASVAVSRATSPALLNWIPFSGSIAGVALIIAAGGYLAGLALPNVRRAAYGVAALAALVSVALATSWSTRLAAIAIATTNVLLLTGRYPTDTSDD